MLNRLSIKKQVYWAFALLLAAVTGSVVLNERLVASFSAEAESSIARIESLSLNSQSILSHAAQARIQLATLYQNNDEISQGVIMDHLWRIQTLATIMIQEEIARDERHILEDTKPPSLTLSLEQIIQTSDQALAYFEANVKHVAPDTSASSEADDQFDQAYRAIVTRLFQVAQSGGQSETAKQALTINFHLANSHIFLEEFLMGDHGESMEEVIHDIDQGLGTAKRHIPFIVSDIEKLKQLSMERIRAYQRRVAWTQPIQEQMQNYLDALVLLTKTLSSELAEYDKFIMQRLKKHKNQLETMGFIFVAISVALVITLSFILIKRVLTSLATLRNSLLHIANNDFNIDVPMQEQQDELGEIARALQNLKIKAIERKGFENANLAIKERLEGMLFSAPVGLMEVDKEGTIILANRALEKILGFEPKQLAGRKLESILPIEIQKRHVGLRDSFIYGTDNQKSMNAGRVFEIKDQQGQPKFLQVGLSKTKNDQGDIYVIASVLDVTKQTQLQTALQEQTDLFESMIYDAPEAIIITNPDRTIKAVNPTFCSLFNYEPDDVLHKDTSLLYMDHDAYLQTGLDHYHPLAHTQAQAFEINYRKKDGSTFLAETVGGAIRSQQGVILGYVAFIRDITERKQQENRLQEYQRAMEINHRRLNLATESAAMGIWEYHIPTETLHWNDVMFDLYGIDKSSFTSKLTDWSDRVHPEDLTSITENLNQCIKSGADLKNSFRINHKTKGVRYLQVHASMLLNEKGEVETVIGINRDETEDKQTQRKLERNHQLLNAISRAQTEFISEKDVQLVFDKLLMDILTLTDSEYGFIGEILYKNNGSPYLKTHAITNIAWNDETKEFYEQNKAQGLIFENLDTLFGECIKTQKTIISNHPKNHPAAAGTPDGHPPLNAFLGQPFFFGSQMIGMIGIANRPQGYDNELVTFLQPLWTTLGQIVDALRQEKVRKEQETKMQQLALVASKTKSGVIITDKEGYATWCNEAFSKISGYKLAEIMGNKPGRLLQGPASDPDTIEFINDQIKKQQGFQADIINYHKHGRPYWVSLEIQPVVNDQGELTEFIAVETDITQKKIADEELHDAVARAEAFAIEAEQASKAKSEFLANMSHEIRTPMNGVLGMLNILMRDKLNEQQLHYVQLAHNSAESLLTIINDILDFSKIEAGKLEIESIDFELPKLIHDFHQSFIYRTQEKNLSFDIQLDENLDTFVVGDPSRIRQILTNICGNAVKFTEKGGITLRASRAKGDLIQFDVEDTGIGIKQDQITNLFNKFTQEDGSTTRKYGGTGLGLSISKQLCQMMGGDITATSTKGEGSCFSFTVHLPISKEPNIIEIPYISLHSSRILVVDDNQTNLDVVQGLLKNWGAETRSALSSKDTIDILQNDRAFDVIILDMQLPEQDGLGLLQEIKERHPDIQSRFLLMTSLIHELSNADMKYLGLSGKLSKPVSTHDLHQALSVLVDNKQALKQSHGFVDERQLQSAKKGVQILLVEDNLINQEVAKAILDDLGYVIETAENGKQAIERLQQKNEFKFVLMDCQMPVMDGYECTEKIRLGEAGDALKDIPIIAMTANAMKGDEERCIACGMNDYLSKPLDLLKLEEVLTRWREHDWKMSH